MSKNSISLGTQRRWRLRPTLFLATAIAALTAVVPAYAAPASSHAKPYTDSVHALRPAPAGFRNQLALFYQQAAWIGRHNAVLNKRTKLVALSASGTQALAELSPAELAFLHSEISLVPHWQQVPAELAYSSRTPLKSGKSLKAMDILSGSTCVENGTTFPEPGLSAVIAAQDAAQLADILVEASPDSAIEGAPDPIRIAAVAAAKIVDLTATGVQNAHDLYSECANDQQGTLIQSISDSLANDTTTIRLDITGLKSDLDTGVTNIRADIANLKSDLDSSVTAIRGDIVSLKSDLDSRLTAIAGQITGVQTTLDQTTELRQIHIQVVTPPGGHDILVSTTEGGQPITATLVSIKVAEPSQRLTFTDMTSQVSASTAIPGVLDIGFPGFNAANTIFQIEVKESSTIDGQSVTHYGTILATQSS